MSEARPILESIIEDFSVEKFKRFFREKSQQFVQREENYVHHNDDNFTNGLKIGEVNFSDIDSLLVCTFEVTKPLSERAGKKAQYEKAKSILRSTENQRFLAGIFIFYDSGGNFRFSLVYPESIGTRRQWNHFRRFTYFVDKTSTNKTFRQRIGDSDFSSLEKIKEAFSVEKVTKDFYKEIAYWYFWACKVSEPPEGTAIHENEKEMFIIRLITRIVFVWFMRQKNNLVPNNLFDKQKLGEILKDFSPESSAYYKAILQNLFFATLSTEIKDRKFRSEFRSASGWNEDYGNQYVYRYYDLFQKPEMIEGYFDQIPFLNGGLFECLDDKNNNDYIDGFTERKKYQPIIPNFLFFSNERAVDLNLDFGTKNKSYKVRGLIDILSSFNFTIDENTPDDQDVALDPELLGRVFENLLASFNPETSTTARKATGSYYTPREIVDYMVTESLKTYFNTHLEGIENVDEKLEDLFSNATGENPFSSEESKKLVELIESVKIVDPAVGSGAFPMGALNKMVLILGKVDPGNQLWKQAQLDAADSIPDPSVRREAKEKIEEFFQGKNADYGRKLYLIQKCIYGVDIQQIAVEIAKLRFFISLMVDEKIDEQKENHGIEPLPNLDFKLMRGNSLIEYGSPDLIIKGKDEVKNKLIDSYFEMKEKYFFTSKHKVKKSLFDSINNIIVQLANYDYQKQYDEENKRLEGFKAQSILFGTLPGENLSFEDNRPEIQKQSKKLRQTEEKLIKPGVDHFEWHLYFNEVFEKGGFDIVIANPPYIQLQKDSGKLANLYQNQNFETFNRMGDIYTLFYEKGINLLDKHGVLCFISSKTWMRSSFGAKLRNFLNVYNPLIIVDLGPGVFEAATVDTNILIIQKCPNKSNFLGFSISNDKQKEINLWEEMRNRGYYLKNLNDQPWIISSEIENKLKEKIYKVGKPLKDWDVIIRYGIKTGLNEAFVINSETRNMLLNKDPNNADIIKPLVRGRDIKRYRYEWADLWIIFIPWHFPLHKDITIVGSSEKAEYEFRKNYPILYNYLFQFKDKLLKRNTKETGKRYEWYALQRCANTYYSEFEKEKIVFKAVGKNLTFALLESGKFVTAPSSFMTSKINNYILGILCSTFTKYFILQNSDRTGAGDIMLNIQSFEKIPLPTISNLNKILIEKIEALVENIIRTKNINPKENTKVYEKQIDQLVYKLYGLTPKEIEIVEGK